MPYKSGLSALKKVEFVYLYIYFLQFLCLLCWGNETKIDHLVSRTGVSLRWSEVVRTCPSNLFGQAIFAAC